MTTKSTGTHGLNVRGGSASAAELSDPDRFLAYAAPQCWSTPPGLIQLLEGLLEVPCGLDLAALDFNKKSARWFGPDHVKLSRRNVLSPDIDWQREAACCEGFVWCNPPYRRITPFVDLMCATDLVSLFPSGIFYCLPPRLEQGWFHTLMNRPDVQLVCPNRRVSFLPADPGAKRSSAPGPIMLVYLGPEELRDKLSFTLDLSKLDAPKTPVYSQHPPTNPNVDSFLLRSLQLSAPESQDISP